MASELSEVFEANVGVHQGSVLSAFLFAVVIDVVTELARQGALNDFLYADDFGFIGETIDVLGNNSGNSNQGFYVNLGKTKVVVSGGNTKDDLSRSKLDPLGFCCLRIKINSVFCVQCGKRIHSRCVKVKNTTPEILM